MIASIVQGQPIRPGLLEWRVPQSQVPLGTTVQMTVTWELLGPAEMMTSQARPLKTGRGGLMRASRSARQSSHYRNLPPRNSRRSIGLDLSALQLLQVQRLSSRELGFSDRNNKKKSPPLRLRLIVIPARKSTGCSG